MKTSARNFLIGTVTGIREGVSHDDIEITVGSDQVIATLTRREREDLGLRVGMEACALIKATSILVIAHPHRLILPTVNHLHGVVESIVAGAVNSEVIVTLDNGATIAAIVTQGSVGSMGLAPGDRASVHFKSTSVFVAMREL